MGSSDGEGLLCLVLVDVYKKRFMPQNGQVAILKCSPIWKKMRNIKTLKHYLSLKLKFIPKKKLGNRKLWLYQLEKESYVPYGKGPQIGKVSKLFLIIILTHGTAIWIFI